MSAGTSSAFVDACPLPRLICFPYSCFLPRRTPAATFRIVKFRGHASVLTRPRARSGPPRCSTPHFTAPPPCATCQPCPSQRTSMERDTVPKKLMPAPNTFVSVEGFVTHVDTELEGVTGAVGAIHVSVDNLAFLRKANISPPPRAPGSFHSHFGGLHTNFLRSRNVLCRAIQVSIRLWWTAAAGGSVPNAQPSRAVSSVSER
jgi:hypothetical protein